MPVQPVPVRAVRTRSTRLRKAVDRAYLEKYSTPWELKYAKDLGSPKSRATTIELLPATKRPPEKRRLKPPSSRRGA